MWRAALAVIAALGTLGCSIQNPVASRPSSAASVSRVAASPGTTPGASPYCPGLEPNHPLVIEWLGANATETVVRDVQDPFHGVTLCVLPPGAPRFVTGTKVALLAPGNFTLLDLISGIQTTVLTYAHNDGAVAAQDWSSDGQVFAYGRLTSDSGSIVFHIIAGGADRVVTTRSMPVPFAAAVARIEFSPNYQYIALGTPASVQVRRLDGALVFSSSGTGQLTWAGETPKLYFQGPSGVETWDASHGAAPTPIRSWNQPIASPGRRWLAYGVPGGYPGGLRIFDTSTGTDRSLGNAGDPAWVTSTLLRYTDFVSCSTPVPPQIGRPEGVTRPVIYDSADGSKTVTIPAFVFASWPRGTPAW